MSLPHEGVHLRDVQPAPVENISHLIVVCCLQSQTGGLSSFNTADSLVLCK